MTNVVKAIYSNIIYCLIVGPLMKAIRALATPIIIYNIGTTALVLVTYFFEYRKYKAIRNIKQGFADHRHEVKTDDTQYETILTRISDAYIKAKKEQEKVKQPYHLSPLWQGTLDKQYSDLISALRSRDTRKLQDILENFSRNPMSANQGGEWTFFALRANHFSNIFL